MERLKNFNMYSSLVPLLVQRAGPGVEKHVLLFCMCIFRFLKSTSSVYILFSFLRSHTLPVGKVVVGTWRKLMLVSLLRTLCVPVRDERAREATESPRKRGNIVFYYDPRENMACAFGNNNKTGITVKSTGAGFPPISLSLSIYLPEFMMELRRYATA